MADAVHTRDTSSQHPHESKRIIVTGASGLVGTHLCSFLATHGHRVVRLVRRAASPGEIEWNPARGEIDTASLAAADAVVHLGGVGIAARFTPAHKCAVRESRVGSTRLLSETLAGLHMPPRVFACASAIGYYGDRGDEILTEYSPPGRGFLADACREWEQACEPARRAGIRVVNLRLGLVLSAAGGALPKMLTPFKLGLGGVIGGGHQYMSWIALADVISVIHAVMLDDTLVGPINVVSPAPVTNREFTKTLGRVLHRPTVVPLPAFAVKLLFGEMGQTLLLEGARVLPAKLQAAGFGFGFPTLETALWHELEGVRK